jgi:hypothetical protein
VLAALTAGLDDRRDVLFASLNWQVENGLRYFTKYIEPDVLWTRAADVAIYAPALARDNLAIGRTIVATERARADLDAAYGPLFEWRDGDAAPRSLADVARQLPAGTSYVLCVLRPSGEFPLNKPELAAAVASLTGGQVHDLGSGEYAAIAGATREKPVLMVSADRPFRSSATIGGLRVEIRIESWLAFDTIRRMGFGQVIANRHHALIVERGVSLVALDDRGYPVDTVYSANIFAPQPRYVLRLLHLP